MVKTVIAFVVALVLSGSAFAAGSAGQGVPPGDRQEGSGARGSEPPRIPPQAAIDACTGRSEGTACEISTPEGSRAGTCAYTPDKTYFACRPDRPENQQGGPGGAGGSGTQGGSGGSGGTGGPGGGQGGGATRIPPQTAIDACAGKATGTACQMLTPGGAKSGTCVFTPDNLYFACRPDDAGQGMPPQREGRRGQGQQNPKSGR